MYESSLVWGIAFSGHLKSGTEFVCVNDCTSTLNVVNSYVLQDVILGPLLFLFTSMTYIML